MANAVLTTNSAQLDMLHQWCHSMAITEKPNKFVFLDSRSKDIEVICIAVFHFPRLLTFKFLCTSLDSHPAAHSLKELIVISRAMIIVAGIDMASWEIGWGGWTESSTRVVDTMILSATGSIKAPKAVASPIRLAKNPSNQSVTDAMMNTAAVVITDTESFPKLLNQQINKTGTRIRRINVSNVGSVNNLERLN